MCAAEYRIVLALEAGGLVARERCGRHRGLGGRVGGGSDVVGGVKTCHLRKKRHHVVFETTAARLSGTVCNQW